MEDTHVRTDKVETFKQYKYYWVNPFVGFTPSTAKHSHISFRRLSEEIK